MGTTPGVASLRVGMLGVVSARAEPTKRSNRRTVSVLPGRATAARRGGSRWAPAVAATPSHSGRARQRVPVTRVPHSTHCSSAGAHILAAHCHPPVTTNVSPSATNGEADNAALDGPEPASPSSTYVGCSPRHGE